MPDIELSVMLRGADTLEILQAALKPFESQHRLSVHVTVLDWSTAWTELVKMALYGHGPVVSEIGSTWVGNLVAMNALRPYAAADQAGLGGAARFLPAAWAAGQMAGDATQWSIPWTIDTRLIYYRRDWFARAGIDAAAACASAAQLDQALNTLLQRGTALPWVMVPNTQLGLHGAASWVWAAGGDFVSPEGKQALFNQPAALAGLRAFFDLRRYFASLPSDFGSTDMGQAFGNSRAAAILSGPWMWVDSVLHQRQAVPPEVLANLGMALPAVPFVGGSHLVVWKHTPQPALALELIQFLTQRETLSKLALAMGMFPARNDVWKMPPYGEAPLQLVEERLLQAGRSFPTFSMWGLVEDKLVATFNALWPELYAAAPAETDAILHRHLDPLAERLNATLAR